MKKTIVFLCIAGLHCSMNRVLAQRNIAEATLLYEISIQSNQSSPQANKIFSGATSTVYLKGNNSRIDRVNSMGKEVIIFNSKQNKGVILKDFSGQQLMITLNKADWENRNKMYNNLQFELTGESKQISGYLTKKAIAKAPDGKTFDVYYDPMLIPANKDYNPGFTGLPGLPVQFEVESGTVTLKYTLSAINYDAIPISTFDFPTSGYRIMTYEENQRLKKRD